jgi:aspartyl/glutamyl-tRNA(Asn/Gln) amidotransferase C subunit
MELTDVEKLAELSNIEIVREEKQSLLADFGSILAYIKTIETVKLDDVVPVYDLKNVWREDRRETREFSPELITGQFPDSQDGFLKVKKIL